MQKGAIAVKATGSLQDLKGPVLSVVLPGVGSWLEIYGPKLIEHTF